MRLSILIVGASSGLALASQCCYSQCGSAGCNGPTEWCSQSQQNCEGSCNGHFCADGPGPAPGPSPTPPSPSPGTRTAGGSHFWDCSGMGCDAGTLQPWDPSKYKATAAYAPMDPADHGGALYGEKMWMVGAASDALSSVLGPNDPCCGSHQEGGCGKCVLVSVDDAVHNDWTAVVMKKSQCPPNSHGCDVPHLDLAVPGYDNLQYSTANTCGSDHTTCSKEQSAVCGNWYDHGSSTIEGCDCSGLPEGNMRKGCELFTSWGWKRGDPTLHWKPVECPAALKELIHDSFGPSGPQQSLATNSTGASRKVNAKTTDGNQCCYSQCGSAGCNGPTEWCSQSQQNCEGSCQGHFCPAGPSPGPAPGPTPTPPAPSPGTSTAGGSHFWDCSGMGCDAGTLQPWDPSKYKATAAYAPMDPADHGGALYGEKMWMVGAASDALSAVLGPNDPCCGSHQEGGCGKCVLISLEDAVHSDWTAVVMKKSQCPPNSHGCDVPHLDLAVPGYDNLQYSRANTCGSDYTTCSKAQSSVCGTWYNRGSSTIEGCDCSSLPQGNMRKGCELFTSWGWKRGDPTLHWKPVQCPSALKQIIHDSFGPSGPTGAIASNATLDFATIVV